MHIHRLSHIQRVPNKICSPFNISTWSLVTDSKYSDIYCWQSFYARDVLLGIETLLSRYFLPQSYTLEDISGILLTRQQAVGTYASLYYINNHHLTTLYSTESHSVSLYSKNLVYYISCLHNTDAFTQVSYTYTRMKNQFVQINICWNVWNGKYGHLLSYSSLYFLILSSP